MIGGDGPMMNRCVTAGEDPTSVASSTTRPTCTEETVGRSGKSLALRAVAFGHTAARRHGDRTETEVGCDVLLLWFLAVYRK